MFTRSARARLWAYGLGDMASMIAVAVICAGMLTAIVHALLALFYDVVRGTPCKDYSSTELVISALERPSRGEFAGLEGDMVMSQVRFQMTDGGPLMNFQAAANV